MNKLASGLLKTTSLIWYTTVLLVLAAGWAVRDKNYLAAETGIGYWFGIIGGSMMLLLLIYPLRKRFNRWTAIGSVKSWFRIHMILGIVGPVAIIFHSGFKLGSFNSSIALFCMLIVATSGLVGRSLYQHIHHGLYGRKIRFEEFYSDSELPGLLLDGSGDIGIDVTEAFETIESGLTQRHTGHNRSLRFYLGMKSRITRLQRRIDKSNLDERDRRQVGVRLKSLRSICLLGINEILFSYWHVLHLPLFVMMVLSGIVHVAVVHLY